ncbi:diglucosylglycerate octanoyltransferase [Nocardia sp. NPDC058176]|uniref:diglucosylglycerate octanoyltransferase n=1 Tax=Nocardia sp. NPDC058176 TaxID=3346368 RepID=UPI0036DB8DCD
MSSEEPVRSVPDELFQQVTAKAGRQLPDALFGPPPARPARPEREEPIRSVPDELFQQVTARSTRSLPDALFGPPPAPVEPETTAADESDTATDDSVIKEAEEPPPSETDATVAIADTASSSAVRDTDRAVTEIAALGEDRVAGAKDASDDAESAGVTADSDRTTASTTDVAAAAPGSADPGRTAPSGTSTVAGSAVGTSASAASTEPRLADPASAPGESSTADADGIVETDSTTADSAPVTSAVHTATAPTAAESTDLSVADASTASGTASAASESATSVPTVAVSGGPAVADLAAAETDGLATGGLASADTAATAVAADFTADTRAAVLETSAESSATAASAPVTDGSAGAGTPVASSDVDTATAVAVGSVVAEPVDVGSVTAHAVPQGDSLAVADSVLVQEDAAERPVESASPRPVLLVIADSLAYYGPKGGLPADDPRIWPNMVAAELDWDVELIARIGWTCRDAYWALIGDPRVWAAVPRAGAVVFAVGGMDTLPSPLPTALRELIRYIRPPRLRRGVRASYNWLQPKLSKLGRPVALPPRVSVDYLEQSREALAHLRPELPVVAVLPSVHKCDAYGRVHRGRARAVKALQAWSGKTSVPLVDLGAAVRDDIESGSANPDGIHWGWAGHAAVATAMTKALQEVR